VVPSKVPAMWYRRSRLAAELRLTHDEWDKTIRVTERIWVYTTARDQFREVDMPGEHK
jgi:hypothetical protein